MKKLVVLLIAYLLVLCATGCATASDDSYESTNESTTNNYYTTPTQKILSASEKEEIAKNAAISVLYYKIQNLASYKYKFQQYDIDATKYQLGSIKKTSTYKNEYEVYGKIYFYDKYGDLKDYGTFTCRIVMKADGSVTEKYASIEIDYDTY